VEALRNPTFIPLAYTIKRNTFGNNVVLSLCDVDRISPVGWVKALRNPTFIPLTYIIKRNALGNHVLLSFRYVAKASHYSFISTCRYNRRSLSQEYLITSLIYQAF
jgi:hypothetical protein